MTIAHRASTTTEATTTGAIVNNVPTGTVNGDLLLWRYSDTNATPLPATPTGWTLLLSGTTTATEMALWYRIAASEPASYTTGVRTASRAVGIMSAFSGVDNVTPFDVTTPAFVAGTTATTCPAITPVTAGAWVLGIGDTNVAAAVTTTTYSSANLTAVDAQVTSTTASTNNVGAVGHFVWVSGAFTPTFTASQTQVRSLGASVALRPATTTATSPPPPRLVNRAALIRAARF